LMNNDGQEVDSRVAELEAVLAEAQRKAEELQAANDQLRNIEQWYQGATNAADVGTWAWDLKTDNLYWTKSCKALFGLPPDAHVDYKVFSDLLHPEDREAVDEAVQRALRDLDEYDVQSRIIWPDGTLRWLRFKGRAYPDRSGRAVRFQGIVIDIWRQKQAEAELRQALERERELRERASAAESNAQSILESMAEGFCGMDSELRYTYVNAAAEAIVGLKREQLIGKTMREVFPEAGGSEIEAICQRALSEGKTVEFSTLFDPWNRWFNIKVYPSGTGLTIYFREITSQKQMEVALLDTQERFEMINNFIPVMAFTTRPNGHLDYVNRRWTEYTGASAEALQGWGWTDLIHPDDRDRTIARWKHSLHTGETFEIECRLLRSSDQTYRWFLAQAVPVRDRNGKTARWFGTCTDIEDGKRVEAELAAARRAAEEASQAKSQFLASMSHELRTPLNAIIGYSEMLQEEVQDLGANQLAPDLARIHTAGRHLLSLISDILDLSKIEAGKMDIFVEEVEIANMVEEVAATVQPLIEKNGNRLQLRIQPETGSMTSDVTKVRQGLFNLLSNASKFTNEGQITVDVSAEKEHGLDWIVFRVSDTGIGMPQDKLDKLFEPFAQLHSGAVKAGGTGLGLAITKRFCEMLGGEIQVDSEEGKGSTFTIRLPRNVGQAAQSEREPQRDPQSPAAEG
ncbi:MAG: PAS domain S-box protein, partial [Acidobacteriaceae bacterium]|nr:PAS domain S-box protein [Acidobacteriaceae bacterium]